MLKAPPLVKRFKVHNTLLGIIRLYLIKILAPKRRFEDIMAIFLDILRWDFLLSFASPFNSTLFQYDVKLPLSDPRNQYIRYRVVPPADLNVPTFTVNYSLCRSCFLLSFNRNVFDRLVGFTYWNAYYFSFNILFVDWPKHSVLPQNRGGCFQVERQC